LGKKLIVHSFTGIFEYFPTIKQFCVIQKDLYGIDIEYIEGENFELIVLDQLKTELLTYIDEEFNINFIKVEEILPTKSGKPQIIISKL
jgi:phenylacetate-CoA ligase